MTWIYPTLIVSLAANVGLLFYIVVNHQLDKWEKKYELRYRTGFRLYQPFVNVPRAPAEPRGEAIVKTDIRPQARRPGES